MSVEGSCHCGAVRIAVGRAPTEVTTCNCSICRRLGTLWAYYAPAEVTITGATTTYGWGERNLDFHRCATCGCITHWAPAPGRDIPRMGINVRLLDPEVVGAAQVRHYDGASD